MNRGTGFWTFTTPLCTSKEPIQNLTPFALACFVCCLAHSDPWAHPASVPQTVLDDCRMIHDDCWIPDKTSFLNVDLFVAKVTKIIFSSSSDKQQPPFYQAECQSVVPTPWLYITLGLWDLQISSLFNLYRFKAVVSSEWTAYLACWRLPFFFISQIKVWTIFFFFVTQTFVRKCLILKPLKILCLKNWW